MFLIRKYQICDFFFQNADEPFIINEGLICSEHHALIYHSDKLKNTCQFTPVLLQVACCHLFWTLNTCTTLRVVRVHWNIFSSSAEGKGTMSSILTRLWAWSNRPLTAPDIQSGTSRCGWTGLAGLYADTFSEIFISDISSVPFESKTFSNFMIACRYFWLNISEIWRLCDHFNMLCFTSIGTLFQYILLKEVQNLRF